MFCKKCGQSIDDNVRFCPHCGAGTETASESNIPVNSAPVNNVPAGNAPVYSAPVNNAPAGNAQAYSAPAGNAPAGGAPVYTAPVYGGPAGMNPVPPKKKSKAPLIIAAAILGVLLIAGGVFAFVIFGPVLKVNKAMEDNDIQTVSEYYYKLSDKDKENVEERMLEYSGELADKFLKGEMTYDDIEDDLEILGSSVLKKNEKFEEIQEEVEELKKSKESFAAAESAFKNEDYEKALDLYSKVIPSDPDHKTASDRIDECKAMLIPDITGEWECLIGDMGDYLLEDLADVEGFEGLDVSGLNISVPFRVFCVFNDDGTGRIWWDEDSFNESYSEALGDLFAAGVDIGIDQALHEIATSYGVSESEAEDLLDEMFLGTYGMTYRDYVRSEALKELDNLDFQQGEFEGFTWDFTYVMDKDSVTIESSEYDPTTLAIVDDTLQATGLENVPLEPWMETNWVFTRR